jgi:pSer/pThr/pTyr-binding forkhead associated (FHA) protein
VRILDDRSLNGVFVNGERVEWSALTDGDEILVGCHSLRFIDTQAPAEDAETVGPRDAHSLAGS